jgi:hypothetical protein
MADSTNSTRNAILLTLEISMLVLTGCLSKQPRVLKIKITGTKDQLAIPDVPKEKYINPKNHESVEWQNRSKTPVLVCMSDAVPDASKRAFAPMFFYLPIGANASSGPLRKNADAGTPDQPKIHFYNAVPDPPDDTAIDDPAPDCTPTGGEHIKVGPKGIPVGE